EADLEVLGAPAERPDHGDVRLGHTPRQRLAAWRHDAPGRLVTEDAAVVRGVADGGADIAARLEAGEACGQGGRGAAGGATRRAGPLEIGRDDGVERRIVLLDASEIELEELCAADLLATDQ